nr:hypothetical protein [Chloroflexota bacterium]
FIPMNIKLANLLGKTIDEFFSYFSTGITNVSSSINMALIGKEIHEIQPIVFGGDPLDQKNKIPLHTKDYAELVVFWNKIWKSRNQETIGQPFAKTDRN